MFSLSLSLSLFHTKNQSYRLNKTNTHTHTHTQVLPASKWFPDHELFQALEFRSKKRFPVVTFRDSKRHTVMLRCSQPLVGVSGRHDVADEKLVDLYRQLGSDKKTLNPNAQLTIVDCRALIAARANHARGGGVESINRYKKCDIRFLDIDNIHTMRASLSKVAAICSPLDSAQNTAATDPDGEDWFSRLSASKWMKHIHRVVAGSIEVARLMRVERKSVLVHCSDGWDRTSQICAIAQLLLDPYYRTIEGFAVLVQKDWCAFGHKFHDRLGHGHVPELSEGSEASPYFATKESSPVFLQFLEAVAQIQRQIPDAFEFNSELLIFLADASYSCEFGNFLCNNERERDMLQLYRNSTSVWDYVLDKNVQKSRFANHSYELERGAIWPSSATRHLVFWDDYYMRFDPCRLRSRGAKKTTYGMITPCSTPAIMVKTPSDEEEEKEEEAKEGSSAVPKRDPPGL